MNKAVTLQNETLKLCRVYSTLPAYRGRQNVLISWLVHERPQPITTYENLVEGYRDMVEVCQRYYRSEVDRSFTLAEAEVLCQYLEDRLGVSAEIDVFETPFTYENDDIDSWEHDVYRLEETPGYSLPFCVWGYYEPQYDTPLPALDDLNAAYPLETLLDGLQALPEQLASFFRCFGELTGVYFRQEGNSLKVTLSNETAFSGNYSDLIVVLREALERPDA